MKISTRMLKGIVVLSGVLFLLAPLTAFTANKVVVIPLFDTINPKPLKNIVTVAKANGTFTDPVAAVASITDASQTNPYLVVIGPGVYTVTSPLVMKQWVDITGSGENVTRIKGAISTGSYIDSVIIKGANNSALSSLTVENTGGGVNCTALFNSGVDRSANVNNVTAIAWGGTINIGVYNISSSYATMRNVTAMASGGSSNFAIHNNNSNPLMTDITATAWSGTNSYGVYNYNSNPTMTNLTAEGTGGTYNYGVCNESSSPVIRRGTMKGDNDGLNTTGGTAYVSQSTIINGVSGTGTKNCAACDKGDGTVTNSSCE